MDNNINLNNISVAQLKQVAQIDPNDYIRDDFIISTYQNNSASKLLKYPCRVDALIIAIVLRGTVKVTINLNEWIVKENMVVANLPGNINQTNGESDDFEGHIIVVSKSFLREIHVDLKNTIPLFMYMKDYPCQQLSSRDAGEILRFFNLIRENMEQSECYREEIIRGLVSSLFYKCVEKLNNVTSAISDSARSRKEIFFQQFMELLQIYHKEQRSVGFYAEKMHITPKYMSSMMKQISGRSAAEWIDEYVILEAKNLLKYSGMSIQEITYFLNFSTQSFFGKYFKQHTGMSPSQYRMQ